MYFLRGHVGMEHQKETLQVLTSEILAELSLGQPVASRLKVARELQGKVREKRLQEQGVLLLWVSHH